MADFSKQWCDLNDPDMPYDFDILEEYRKLQLEHYVSYICEGFGFLAIGKDHNGDCILAMPDESRPYDADKGSPIEWVKYEKVVK